MFHDCVGSKQRQVAAPHHIGQKKSVFTSERDRIKNSSLNIHSRSSNCKAGGVQVSNATVRLEKVSLKRSKPQFFGPTNCPRAVSNNVELKTTVLWGIGNNRSKGSQTVCLQSAVSVYKYQH